MVWIFDLMCIEVVVRNENEECVSDVFIVF